MSVVPRTRHDSKCSQFLREDLPIMLDSTESYPALDTEHPKRGTSHRGAIFVWEEDKYVPNSLRDALVAAPSGVSRCGARRSLGCCTPVGSF